jgi:hypothetical protein
MKDELKAIEADQAELARRITKDTGDRQINEETGFQRDVDGDKFKFSDHADELCELFLNHQDIDDSDYLNTDWDEDGVDAEFLIHPLFLNRMAAVLARGAKKYGVHNWQRGNNLSRSYDSKERHSRQWYLGDTSEDHLAAEACNIMFLMIHEHNLQHGIPFVDEEGELLGKHQEFADAGALFMDAERYNMNQLEEDDA